MKQITEKVEKTVIKYVTEKKPTTMYISDDGLYKSSDEYNVEKYEATKDIKHQHVDIHNYIYGCDAYLVENEEQRKSFEKYFKTSQYREEYRIPINKWFIYNVIENNDYPDEYNFYVIENLIKELQDLLNNLEKRRKNNYEKNISIF